MTLFRSLLILCPAVCLLAQTPPRPAQNPVPVPPIAAPSAPAAPAPAAKPVAPDDVVITVGDMKVTEWQYERILESLPQNYQAAARGAQKKQFGDFLVRILVAAQEGRKRNLDQSPAYQIQATFAQANLLATVTNEAINKSIKVDEAEMRKYYEEHKGEFEQVRARHILIRAQGSPVNPPATKKELSDDEALAKAKELRGKLEGGADFAELAKAESDDAGSGSNGGELGTFHHGQMVPPFDQAAFALKPGELSQPVKTQFGYHLIQTESKDTRSFDDVKSELETRMRPAAAQKAIDDLVKKSGAVLNADFFGLPKQ